MRRLPKPKMTTSELAQAIVVLKRLQRHIDYETQGHVAYSGRWFLERERAELITRDAVQQTQSVIQVIRLLIVWHAALGCDQGDSK